MADTPIRLASTISRSRKGVKRGGRWGTAAVVRPGVGTGPAGHRSRLRRRPRARARGRRLALPGFPRDPQRRLVLGDRHPGLDLRLAGHPPVHPVHERRIALAQVLVRDAQAPGQQRKGELDGLQPEVPLGVLEPPQAGPRRPLQRLDRTAALVLVGGQGGGERATSGPRGIPHRGPTIAVPSTPCIAPASAIPSSIASRVPDPTEKCAVWAASPISTTLPADQRSFAMVGNRRHSERFAISGWPCELLLEQPRQESPPSPPRRPRPCPPAATSPRWPRR